MRLRVRAGAKTKGRGGESARKGRGVREESRPKSSRSPASFAAGARLPGDFRLLIDNAPLMIWLSDADNRCFYFNRTWLEFTGRPLAAERGAGWLAGVHPQDRKRVRRADREGFASRRPFNLQYRLLRHDGEYRSILDQCTPRRDARGRFIGYLGSCTDVTELREVAADALKWKRRYQAALNSSGWISYEIDLATKRVEWSPAIESLLGYPVGELTDAPGWVNYYVHADDREHVREELRRVAPHGGLVALLYRVRHREGHYVWLEDRIFFLGDRDTEQSKYIGFVSDVSERVRNEEQLRRSEERFRLAAEAVDGIVFELDVHSRVATTSGRLVERLGHGEMTGATVDAWAQLVHPDERDHALGTFDALARAGTGAAEAEYRVRDAQGNYHHLLTRMLIRQSASGAPARVFGCALDISAQKQAEHQILQLNAELEQRVEDRTAALQAVVQELEAFTYSVSHDLRAPLRHVAGFTDLLRARIKDPDTQVQRYLDTIGSATARMAEMIDKLLALSRVGRGEMRPSAVDLGELVAEVREELAPTLDDRMVEWRIGKLPVVRADRALLRGAMQNLLANAVKFTAGRVPAVIEIAARGDAREHEIVVRDNGAGFDMRYVNKLFGVFQRLHAPGEFEGTGIGLASVRRIINRHGGRVWAQGKPGAGAEFHFTLPAREEQ